MSVSEQLGNLSSNGVLRVGFVRLLDAAPIIVAREKGFFEKYGIDVKLSRELGWASIRDKIAYGELDAAQAICSMPYTMTWGSDGVVCPCQTGLILNYGGNAITVSHELHEMGVVDAKSLQQAIFERRALKKFIFGVVSHTSTHHFILREWLEQGGVDLERDVQVVVVPPDQMERNLRVGNIDGYCVGEPWNSAAFLSGTGYGLSFSIDSAPNLPEKVLLVQKDFAESQPQRHYALLAALMEALKYCEDEGNSEELSTLLAHENALSCPIEYIKNGLSRQFASSGEMSEADKRAISFYRPNANRPTLEKAELVFERLRAHGCAGGRKKPTGVQMRSIFNEDYYDAAERLLD